MKNRIEITSDGINAYANIKVNASKIGIGALSIVIISVLILMSWIFSISAPKNVIEIIISILLTSILLIGLPVKYLLWNLYGNEQLIVNTKSISWSYDYGFFKTNLKTIKFDRLGTGYEHVRGENGEEVGKLIFYNYNKEDNLPKMIHETTVLLSRDEIFEFDNQISILFENEFYDKNCFVPFSSN